MTESPIRPWNSLRWRFSALLIILIAASGMLQLYFSTRGWRLLVEHLEQQINWDLASDIAERIQPTVKSTFDPKRVESLLHTLTIANPKAEFLFLDSNGVILGAFPYRDELAVKAIDPEPLRRALEPELPPLPLYADDPFSSHGKKIFSVARLVINNQPGYLYVPLMSSTYAFFIRNAGQFYLANSIALGLFLSWFSAILSGFLLFFLLSRRFLALGQTISRFQSGDLLARAPQSKDDELGRLAVAFNQMAETIAENTQELQRKDLLRKQLIANISHDLRGPVTSTLAHLDAMLSKVLTESERKNYLQVLQENALSQSHMIEDLFELSILEANEERLDKDYCSLQRIAESVLESLSPLAMKKSLTLQFDIPTNLPLLFADSGALQRVISNLLSNAIRYTPEGGYIQLTARDLRHEVSDRVSVCVSDTGIGIPSEELPHIFDSFYRANKHRPEDPGGTGLGLAIVKRLLALHGSEVQVESTVDTGTTITFTLPTEPDS